MRRFRKRQWISIALIVAGLLLILVTFGMNMYASWENRRMVKAFRETYLDTSAAETDEMQKGTDVTDESEQADNERLEEDAVIAILRIPVIDCEEVVKDGSGRWTLAKALGHMEGTTYPGQVGNCVIAGHRNYNFGLYFNRLNEVQIDDEIQVDTKEATYTYKVSNIKVVEPEDLSVLEQTDNATITLITCTPIYVATHRLIVSGELTDIELR